MSILIDDLTIGNVDGNVAVSVFDDQSTTVAVSIQVRGAAVTPDSATVVAKRGSESVTLTPTLASGRVSAVLTAGNIDTLSATVGSKITVFWEVLYTDDSDLFRARHEMTVVVTDRRVHFALDYADLERQMPQIARSCSYPLGQTNWWPQVRIAIRNLRNRVNREQGGLKDYLITNPDEWRQLVEYAALAGIMEAAWLNAGGRSAVVVDYAEMYQKRHDNLYAELVATVKAAAENWQENNGRRRLQIKSPRMWTDGRGSKGFGGPL